MQLYEVPKERRYWVVRAEGGLYFDHFVTYGIIALGHMDILNLPEQIENPYQPDMKVIQKNLFAIHKSQNISSRSTSTHLNQISTFLYDIQIGDWVLTIGANEVKVGRVIGHPRLSKKTLCKTYNAETNDSVYLDYNLRRNVEWGPTILRSQLPYGLAQSLRANQTLFNLDRHWDAIYHTMYPAFIRYGNLHLSANINTTYAVRNYSVSFLFNFLNEIEVLSKEFKNGINAENFDRYLEHYIEEDRLTITTKAQFHSPGEIWNMITSLGGDVAGWPTYCVLAYSMIFGNQKLGFDGLVDLQTRQKLWEIVFSRMGQKKLEIVSKHLDLKAPSHDTKKIESSENDEKPIQSGI
jgi:hypothetical protein